MRMTIMFPKKKNSVEDVAKSEPIWSWECKEIHFVEHDLAVPQIVKHLKSFLMNVKEESGKASLKLNILKTKIMTSSPNTSRQKMGGKCEKRDRFHFFVLQNYCRSSLQPWNQDSRSLERVMTKLDSIL